MVKKTVVLIGLLLAFGCLGEAKEAPVLHIQSSANLSAPAVPPAENDTHEIQAEIVSAEAKNVSNETILECPAGYYLDDGQCVKPLSPPPASGNESEDEGMFSQTETSTQNETPRSNISLNFTLVPPQFKEPLQRFVGDEEEFKNLSEDLGRLNSTERARIIEKLRAEMEKFRRGELGKLNPILKDVLVGSVVPRIKIDLTPLMPKQVSEWHEPDYRIAKLETVWGDERYLNVYFKSHAALYTFVVLEPLNVYIDLDNNGEWDVKYAVVYNDEQNKAYFYVVRRGNPQVLSRPLEYDVAEKKISFKLGDEVYGQRAFVWLGEPHTGLRYPKQNDVIIFLQSGRMMKNTAHYLVVVLHDLKIKDDGDIAQEGEIALTNWMLFSRPLEEINAPEARQLLEYKRQGKVAENEIPHWFAYWLFKANTDNIDGVVFQRTAFPMLRWVEMNDGDEIFVNDRSPAIDGFPAFASTREAVQDSKVVFLSTIVSDYDDWPSSIVDKTGWLLAKLIDSGADALGVPGQIIKRLTELMFYGVSGDRKDFEDIMRDAFTSVLRAFGSPDLIAALSKSLNAVPHQDFNIRVKRPGAEIVYQLRRVNVPTVPLHLRVKLDKIKIRDRSDGLRGEYYFYSRVCTDVHSKGLGDGVSLSWPAGKRGDCRPKRFGHGYVKVWDGDTVAKNVVLAEGDILAKPFVYVELQGWDEDKENWGDDDDPMGLLTRLILLDERNFEWPVESNRPRLHYQEEHRASKTTIYYEVEVE